MTLEVRVGNNPAIELYRRFGYAPAGIRRNYYSEEGEDALIMWAHDVDQPAHADRLLGIERSLGEVVVAPRATTHSGGTEMARPR